jgi:predicted kinase
MINKPFVILLVGVPLSGKSTWIRNNHPTTKVVSRDELVMEVYGSDDYSKAFKEVDQKEVDRLLDLRLKEVNTNKENVIVDMTNMVVSRRVKTLKYFSDEYHKEVIVFPVLETNEYERRNKERNVNENKWIPPFVITSMLNSYQEPTLDEGFDKIIIL